MTLYRIAATRAGYKQDVESTADLATFATSIRDDRYPGARVTESRYAFPGTLYQVKYGARVVANIYPATRTES